MDISLSYIQLQSHAHALPSRLVLIILNVEVAPTPRYSNVLYFQTRQRSLLIDRYRENLFFLAAKQSTQ